MLKHFKGSIIKTTWYHLTNKLKDQSKYVEYPKSDKICIEFGNDKVSS